MGKDMKYTFKLDPSDPDHVAVSEILDGLGRYAKRRLLVAAILAYEQKNQDPGSQAQHQLSRGELKSLIEEVIDERNGEKKNFKGDYDSRDSSDAENQKKRDIVAEEDDQDDILSGLGDFKP